MKSIKHLILLVAIEFLVTFLTGCDDIASESRVTFTVEQTIPIPKLTVAPLPTKTMIPTGTSESISVSPTATQSEVPSRIISAENVTRLSTAVEWEMMRVDDLVWSPDGLLFALVGTEKNELRIHLYDSRAHSQVWSRKTGGGISIDFSADGTLIATGGGDLELWAVSSGQRLDVYRGNARRYIKFISDGQTILLGETYYPHPDETPFSLLRLWDVERRKTHEIMRINGSMWSLEISPDNHLIATSIENQNDDIVEQVLLWDISSQKQICSFQGDYGIFNPSNDMLAVAEGEVINLWDVRTCQLIGVIEERAEPFSLAFSTDGTLLAFGNNLEHGSIQIWDVIANKRLYTIQDVYDRVSRLSFSPDGRLLLSVSLMFETDTSKLTLWELGP